MPRDGSGAGDNAVEAEHNIVHGAGEGEVRPRHTSSHTLKLYRTIDVELRLGRKSG